MACAYPTIPVPKNLMIVPDDVLTRMSAFAEKYVADGSEDMLVRALMMRMPDIIEELKILRTLTQATMRYQKPRNHAEEIAQLLATREA